MAVRMTVELTFWTEGSEEVQIVEAHDQLVAMLVANPGVDWEVTAEEFVEDDNGT